MKKLLDYNFPEDLKTMSLEEKELLAIEIRQFLIDSISKTGGHLASNLGIVELTIAIDSFFDIPKDKIIWDVGHQSYVHKILTGRGDQFGSLRQFKGLSGFPKRHESKYDTYDTGHSSNSISIAAGFAAARDMKNEDYQIVSVIGDGAMTGGLSYEGLNNLAELKSKAIIILNDNGMSIGKNTGGLSKHLSKIRVSQGYRNFKTGFGDLLKKVPNVGERLYKGAVSIRDHMKYSLVDSVMFEQLGFTCIGPVDGHNIAEILEALEMAKNAKDSVILHIITKKGKGYLNAERNPSKFHGTGAFDKTTGAPLKTSDRSTYSDIYGDKLSELARKNDKIVAISAAMIQGTGLQNFAKEFPKRTFDTGIAEGHAVTFAGAMAVEGMKPFVSIYSTFLQRAYDNVIIDVCLQKAPVVFALDRAGIVGADGSTHHGIFDIAYLKNIPNLEVMAPSCKEEFQQMLEYCEQATLPVAIRYPRGGAIENYQELGYDDNLSNQSTASSETLFSKKAKVLTDGADICIWSYGNMLEHGAKAAKILEENGLDVGLVDSRFLVPFDRETLIETSKKTKMIVTLEDGVLEGGFGETVNTVLMQANLDVKVMNFGWPKEFIEHGTVKQLMELYRIDSDSIAERILDKIEK